MKKTDTNMKAPIKSVSPLPGFLLTLQGRLDAKRGTEVVTARIDKLKDKCTQLECGEYDNADRVLAGTRATASVNLAKLFRVNRAEAEIGDAEIAEDVHTIRRNERNKTDKTDAQAVLYQIRPVIIHINTLLSERVVKTRKKASVKIDAYVKGVRRGGIVSFTPDMEFSEEAYAKYHLENDSLDNAVIRYADYDEET